MASLFSHGIVAVALGKSYAASKMKRRFWVAAVICSVVPDADVIGFHFGIAYRDVMGHRGFSHSLVFAGLMGLLAASLLFKRARWFTLSWWGSVIYFFVVTASHGFLDAMTDGGLGIAFFAPFDNTRYFLPWTPVRVSPIGIQAFFSSWGATVMLSEMVWIWLPAGLICGTIFAVRQFTAKHRTQT